MKLRKDQFPIFNSEKFAGKLATLLRRPSFLIIDMFMYIYGGMVIDYKQVQSNFVNKFLTLYDLFKVENKFVADSEIIK